MTRHEHKSYAYYQIDRPVVGGADSFMRRLKELSPMLGSVTTTAMTEFVDIELADMGENAMRVVRPLQEPVLDVFRQNELRLVLYRRIVDSSNIKANLLHSIDAKVEDNHAFKEGLIASQQGDINGFGSVICDKVELQSDLALGNTLVLVPKINNKVHESIVTQTKACKDFLDNDIPEFGRDSKTLTGVIPVASIVGATNPNAIDDLIDCINQEHLPQRLALGGIHAYRTYALSNTFQYDS